MKKNITAREITTMDDVEDIVELFLSVAKENEQDREFVDSSAWSNWLRARKTMDEHLTAGLNEVKKTGRVTAEAAQHFSEVQSMIAGAIRVPSDELLKSVNSSVADSLLARIAGFAS